MEKKNSENTNLICIHWGDMVLSLRTNKAELFIKKKEKKTFLLKLTNIMFALFLNLFD
jgi:hypothetical protein